MAPQTTEFGTKVALLGGLALVCAARPILDRLLQLETARDRPSAIVLRAGSLRCVASACSAPRSSRPGSPARGTVDPAAAEVLGRVPHDVDPATFPSITVDQDVVDWNHEITGAGSARDRADARREPRSSRAQALRRNDVSILEAVDHGDRLDEMRARLAGRCRERRTRRRALPNRRRARSRCSPPFGRQEGLSLGLESRGTVTAETYDDSGHPAGPHRRRRSRRPS